MTYTLYGHVQSRAIRPLWLLEELGLPYSFVTAKPRSPEALAVHPSGKVPVLDMPEGRMTDSVAMMTLLTDREGRLTHPPGSYARGQQDALTQRINEQLDAVLWAYAKHSFVLPEDHRVPAVKDSLEWQFAQHAEGLAAALGAGSYLMGANPVVPDFLLAHCCSWAKGRGFALPDALRAHMTMMRARPAFRRAQAQGDT
ncbi:MAG: glutathione S-transferase [Pseudomonadota bacterium]